MGSYKHMMEQGYYSDIGESICPNCIKEDGIEDFINKNCTAEVTTCSYCNDKNIQTCNMGLLVGYIYDCIIKEWTKVV